MLRLCTNCWVILMTRLMGLRHWFASTASWLTTGVTTPSSTLPPSTRLPLWRRCHSDGHVISSHAHPKDGWLTNVQRSHAAYPERVSYHEFRQIIYVSVKSSIYASVTHWPPHGSGPSSQAEKSTVNQGQGWQEIKLMIIYLNHSVG